MQEDIRNNKFFYNREIKYANGTIKNSSQLRFAKANNCYLFTVLSLISAADGDATKLPNMFVTRILSEVLPYSDKDVGFSTHEIAAKLKFLVKELMKNEAAREEFNNSVFRSALRDLFYGNTGRVDKSEQWDNFVQTSPLPPKIQKTLGGQPGAQNAALAIYVEDSKVTNVLNMNKVLDTIVKTDENGKYHFQPDNTIATAEPLLQAIKQTIKDLKTNPTFVASYAKARTEQEIEEGDEIENY